MDTMAVSKVIFFLHCTGLAQLSSYVFARTFDACNHRAIVRYYQHELQDRIERELPKKPRDIISCCPNMTGHVTEAGSVLACIDQFTINIDIQPEIRNFTTDVLAQNCDGYLKKNGTQNGEVPFQDSNKCKKQRDKSRCRDCHLLELSEMWKGYLRSVKNIDMNL